MGNVQCASLQMFILQVGTQFIKVAKDAKVNCFMWQWSYFRMMHISLHDGNTYFSGSELN